MSLCINVLRFPVSVSIGYGGYNGLRAGRLLSHHLGGRGDAKGDLTGAEAQVRESNLMRFESLKVAPYTRGHVQMKSAVGEWGLP